MAVAGTANRSVTWSVNDVVGGNATVGTISTSGRYTGPAAVPNPDTVTVKARSVADASKSASATVRITTYTGRLLWLKRFGGTGFDLGEAIAVDGNGDILVTGGFSENVDFGGGVLTSAGSGDVFVAKYSGVDGAHLWSKRFGSTNGDEGTGIAVDGNGDVLVSGNFEGTVDFGGGMLISTGSGDVFMAKYSGVDGTHLWSKRLGGTGDYLEIQVAVDESGDVLATGTFDGSVDFGDGPLTADYVDIFVAKYSGADGAHLWSKQFGDTWDDEGIQVAVDGSGDVLVTGYFGTTVDFGGGLLNTAGYLDIFVVKLSGVDGAHLWSKRLGNTKPDGGMGVAVDGNGDVLVMGFFEQTVNFGGEPLTSAGAEDIFVAKYSGVDGSYFWAKRFGGPGYEWRGGLAADTSDNVLVTGFFYETADFNGEFLTSAGEEDIFLVKLSP